MGLVQAQMAFYHDSVGTKAQNEIFEVQNETLCAELESAGYVKKLEGEQAQQQAEQQQRQQEYGQQNQQANQQNSQQANQQQMQQQAKATSKKANEKE